MRVEYTLNQEDYFNALLELLQKEIWKRTVYIFLISILISYIIVGKPFDWKLFTMAFLTSFVLIFVILFSKSIISIYRNKKLVKSNPLYIGKKIIILEDDGILLDAKETAKYYWNSVLKIEDLSNYIILILQNNTSIIINKKGLKNQEIANFIGKINSCINIAEIKSTTKKSKNIYWLGIIGFIPNFGIIIGAILVYLGFKRTDKKLKLLGIANILFTPLFWFLFIYFTNNSGFIKKSNIEFTNHYLNEVVKDLEYYKSKNGYYPDSLGELRSQNKFFNDNEVFNEISFFEKNKSTKFYYKKTNDTYILKSYGPDRILNTKDDIFPTFK